MGNSVSLASQLSRFSLEFLELSNTIATLLFCKLIFICNAKTNKNGRYGTRQQTWSHHQRGHQAGIRRGSCRQRHGRIHVVHLLPLLFYNHGQNAMGKAEQIVSGALLSSMYPTMRSTNFVHPSCTNLPIKWPQSPSANSLIFCSSGPKSSINVSRASTTSVQNLHDPGKRSSSFWTSVVPWGWEADRATQARAKTSRTFMVAVG